METCFFYVSPVDACWLIDGIVLRGGLPFDITGEGPYKHHGPQENLSHLKQKKKERE